MGICGFTYNNHGLIWEYHLPIIIMGCMEIMGYKKHHYS